MNAIAAPKSSAQNRLEGFALTALLQGLPTFAAAVLVLDAGLSVSDKIAQWRSQPTVSAPLVSTVIMLSLLAVAVVSVR
ncbi:hypothetical protein [Bradyrhizobium ivorense]|uniref:hypothetical protein n=1 Tax=Bradyrhizobium ivorense TaxID=2511166 RepID=UPI0010AF61C3|nr:hypothetical protein [Bradyrhizobium ivorense]VIO80177.1 hypothetical protein CI41S_71370 [Bradyrhizobium ivorense]